MQNSRSIFALLMLALSVTTASQLKAAMKLAQCSKAAQADLDHEQVFQFGNSHFYGLNQ